MFKMLCIALFAVWCGLANAASVPHEEPILSTDKMATPFELFSIKNAAVLHSDVEVQEAWWQSIQQVAISTATYQGPGDIAGSAKVWVGLRAFSAADRGNNLINLCNALDAACVDIASDAVTGKLVAPTNVGGTDCTAVNTCTIKTWYDRSGASNCSSACNLTQATIATRPTLTWSCINSLPCVVFVSQGLATASNFGTVSQTFSTSVVANRTVVGAVNSLLVHVSGTQFGFSNSANTIRIAAGAGATVANVTDNSWHALQAILNGASSTVLCGGSAGTNCSNGGTSTTVNPSTNGLTGAILTMDCSVAGCSFLAAEMGIWAADNTSVRSALNSNQITFWGPF